MLFFVVPVNFLPPAFGRHKGSGYSGGGTAFLEAASTTGFLAPTRPWPPEDWKENPREHVFMADLPRMRTEEIKVEVPNNRILLIRGEGRRAAEAAGEERFLLVERPVGRFTRYFHIPLSANLHLVRSKTGNDGVLTITVPKFRGNEVRSQYLVTENDTGLMV